MTSRCLIGKNFVCDVQHHLKRRFNRFSLVDCRVTMKDFLQDFDIGNHSLPGGDQTLHHNLSFRLVRVRRSNEIHRNVRVDEDQPRYPCSISMSISLM